MNTLDATSLAQLAITALERTAFLTADVADGDLDAIDLKPTYFSIITYAGSETGTVYLEADEEFLREFIANLLGIDEDDVDCSAQCASALNELANILAGLVVIELGGENHHITLGLPTPTSHETSSQFSPDKTCTCLLGAQNGWLRIQWTTWLVHAFAA